ncbi:MAG: hypothetical protein FWD53_02200 [Phycisphaerales bacterium]|nr:hypothetical protein [Phycisphaerales bacterium]
MMARRSKQVLKNRRAAAKPMFEALETRVMLTALPWQFNVNASVMNMGPIPMVPMVMASASAAKSCSGAVQVLNTTTISGWAFSSAAGGLPVDVIITIDGVPTTITADVDRPDLVKKLGSAGHGFVYEVPGLSTGKHTVTVDVVDPVSGETKRLKSGTITISAPVGSAKLSKTEISGYAFSAANQAEPVTLIVTINGVATTVVADENRPEFAKKLKSSKNHGFTYSLPALPTGNNTVTVDIVDPSTGNTKRILSTTIKVGPPTGQVSTFNTSTISGWAFNPSSSSAPMDVVITINGVATTVKADQYVAGLEKKCGTAYHGFTFSMPALPPGTSIVTVDLVDPSTGQTVRLRSGKLTNALPKGSVSLSANRIVGSATDAGMTGSLMVRIDVDGVTGTPFVANDPCKVSGGMNVGFIVEGNFAGKVVEVYAYDSQSNIPVLIWTNNRLPKGAVTSGNGFNVSGWAVDPDDPSKPIQVQVFIDGVLLTTTTANLPRPDVQSKAGALNVGFSVDIPGLYPGTHTITVYAIDGQAGAAKPVLIGTYKVTNAPPTGKVEVLNTSVISGYAYDPDMSGPTTVKVYVNGMFFKEVMANGSNATMPGHGFSVDLSELPEGSYWIMVTAMDDRDTDQPEVVFFDDFLNNQEPVGVLESVTGTTITGWAYDPDAPTAPAEIDIFVDGKYYTTVLADVNRPDLAAMLGAAGTAHGFEVPLPPLTFGTHTIAVYAAESQGHVAVLIGEMKVTNNRPIGAIVSISATNIVGWAYDPDVSTESLSVVVYVNGQEAATGWAGPTGGDLLTSLGVTQYMQSLKSGVNRVDVYAVDPNNGLISLIGTRTITC